MEKRKNTNVRMVLNFIREHKDDFDKLPNTIIQIEKRDINYGDEYDSENGYEYLIFFADKSVYLVGEIQIIEDRDDYAQADSWEQTYCIDYYNELKSVTCLEVLEKLESVLN